MMEEPLDVTVFHQRWPDWFAIYGHKQESFCWADALFDARIQLLIGPYIGRLRFLQHDIAC